MNVKQNGTGFSEEQSPFEGAPSPTTSAEMPANARDLFDLTRKDRVEIEHLNAKYEAFYPIHALWLRRRAEGMTQKDIAEKLGRDPAWVSRALSGPKNWTMRTMGELAHALDGRVTIRVEAAEDLSAEGRSTEAG